MEHMTAKLGGAFIIDADDATSAPGFAETYAHLGYVFVSLPDGTRMQLFYNNETRLFVADIIAADESGGNEFVRCTVPKP